MARVYKRASAKRDLVEDYVYLAEHGGIETAERYPESIIYIVGIRSRLPKTEKAAV
jgi:hypothetical protein